MFCGTCGQNNRDGLKFCVRCGADLRAQSSAPASETEIAPGAEPQPGETLAARYRLERLLGRGGFGAVFRAADAKLGRAVALKFLTRADPGSIERFLAEAQTIAQLEHENIVAVYDVADTPYGRTIVMQYVDGASLIDEIKRGGAMAPERAGAIFRQVCLGIDYAHRRRIIHRDIKPHNVMLTADGRAKILDFGLARRVDLASSEGKGTPVYMAPEQLTGESVDQRCDIYALGKTFYHMLTGELPTNVHPGKLPALYRGVVMTATQYQTAARFASVAQMIQAFDGAGRPAEPTVVQSQTLPRASVAEGDVPEALHLSAVPLSFCFDRQRLREGRMVRELDVWRSGFCNVGDVGMAVVTASEAPGSRPSVRLVREAGEREYTLEVKGERGVAWLDYRVPAAKSPASMYVRVRAEGDAAARGALFRQVGQLLVSRFGRVDPWALPAELSRLGGAPGADVARQEAFFARR